MLVCKDSIGRCLYNTSVPEETADVEVVNYPDDLTKSVDEDVCSKTVHFQYRQSFTLHKDAVYNFQR